MRSRIARRSAAVFLTATGSLAAQFLPGITATPRTPILLTASASGSLPTVDSLPQGAVLRGRIALSATSGRAPNTQAPHAEIHRQVTMVVSRHEMTIDSAAQARCATPVGVSGSAFSTANEIVFTLANGPLVDCAVDIAYAEQSTGRTTTSTQVDVFDDGVTDLDSASSIIHVVQVPLPRIQTSPLVIALRTSSSAQSAGGSGTNVTFNRVTITVRPRSNTSIRYGCIPNIGLQSNGRLDGGVDFTIADAVAGSSPIGANALIFGPAQPLPSPLPAAAGPVGACTLQVIPALVATLPARVSGTQLHLPAGPPIAARPLSLDVQLIGLAGTAAAPALHSTLALPLVFN